MDYLLDGIVHKIDVLDARTGIVTLFCGRAVKTELGELTGATDAKPCVRCGEEHEIRSAKWRRLLADDV